MIARICHLTIWCLVLGCTAERSDRQTSEQPAGELMHVAWYAGDVEQAIADYTAAIERGTKVGFSHANRAVAWHAEGEYAKARADFQQAIALQPEEPLCHQGYAWLLATCPDATFRDGQLAVEQAILYFEMATARTYRQPGNFREHGDRAIRVAVAADRVGGGMHSLFFKGWNWESIETLAAAFAEAGQFDRAVRWQQHAIDIFTSPDGTRLGHLTAADERQMRERLALYQQEAPYRLAQRRAQ